MSSVTEIETAIKKLSLAEQRAIALHLGGRLTYQEPPAWCAAPDEGIRFLAPYEPALAPREPRGEKPRHRAKAPR